jgi:hypothetical protein
MKTRLQFGLVALVGALVWLAPATVDAQARQRYPYGYGQTQIAYDRGYREGLVNGERDGRAGSAFDYTRDRAYQRGGSGSGDRDGSRELFRRGYADGYRDGYARYRRSGYPGGYGYPGDSRYPGGYGSPGDYRYGGYGNTVAYDRGYRDGVDEGRKAGRGNDRYDPYREKDYRGGDAGYNRRYGTKDAYQHAYRGGFLAGYDQGYREARGGGSWRY